MEELRSFRKDMPGLMQLVNANYELTGRLERRVGELRGDIELMVKMELGGSVANIRTSIENSLARIEEAPGSVDQRVGNLENKIRTSPRRSSGRRCSAGKSSLFPAETLSRRPEA